MCNATVPQCHSGTVPECHSAVLWSVRSAVITGLGPGSPIGILLSNLLATPPWNHPALKCNAVQQTWFHRCIVLLRAARSQLSSCRLRANQRSAEDPRGRNLNGFIIKTLSDLDTLPPDRIWSSLSIWRSSPNQIWCSAPRIPCGSHGPQAKLHSLPFSCAYLTSPGPFWGQFE